MGVASIEGVTSVRRSCAGGEEGAMNESDRFPSVMLDVRRRLLRAAAWYASARTTFEVLRLLDEEALLAPVAPPREPRPAFVAHPGFEV
jgi:hypothetical protein